MKSYKPSNGRIIQTAAVIGLIASTSDNNYAVNAADLQHQARDMSMDPDPSDGIGTASADEMFAFSQIIAGGQKPMEVVAGLEKEQSKPKKDTNILNDDQAMAMFSNYVSSGEDINAPVDPEIAAQKKAKAETDKKAADELKDLQSNDATSAFAGLIESQALESRAEKFKGSAPEEEDEDEKPKKPKKKPMPKILPKKKPAAKKTEIKSKSAKKKASKTDAALVGATEEISESTQKAIEASADLPSTPEAAKKAEDLTDLPQKKKGKVDISKFLPKKKKTASKVDESEESPKPKKEEKPKKPAHKVAHKKKKDDMPPQLFQRSDDSLPFGSMMRQQESANSPDPQQLPKQDADAAAAEATPDAAAPGDDTNVDAQADAMIEQIKAAAAGVKGADSGNASDQKDGLEALLTTAGALVQIDDQININQDPDAPTNLVQISSLTDQQQQIDADALANLSTEQLQFMEQNMDQFSLNEATTDEGLNTKEMKDYAKNVADAADVVISDQNDENLSISDLKVQAMEMAKGLGKKDKSLPDSSNVAISDTPEELKQKEAIVAQAEASNSAAMSDSPPSKKLSKAQKPDRVALSVAETAKDKDTKAEKKFNEDKQMALEQGYTDEQSTKFATQEALASSQAKVNAKDEKIETDVVPPEEDISGLKPEKASPKKKGLYDQEVPKDVLSKIKPKSIDLSAGSEAQTGSDSELSIQEQIQQAQKQQQSIKATLEKKKSSSIDTATQEPAAPVVTPKASLKKISKSNVQEAQDLQAPPTPPAKSGAGMSKEEEAQAQAEAQMASMSPEELKELAKEGASGGETSSTPTPAATPAPVQEAAQTSIPVQDPVAPVQAQAQLTADQIQQIQAQAEAQATQEAQEAADLKAKESKKDTVKKIQIKPIIKIKPIVPKPALKTAIKIPAIKPKVLAKTIPKIKAKKIQLAVKKPETPAPVEMPDQEIPKASVTAPKPSVAKIPVMLQEQDIQQPPLAVQQTAIKQATAQVLSAPGPAPAPVAEISTLQVPATPSPAPQPVVAVPQVPQPVPQVAQKHIKTHKTERETLQQQADIHAESSVDTSKSNKKRSEQYESDLNSARDQILKAQKEMKSIDSEVSNFHQKMASSMHSLLKAFTEGFDAMDKAKQDEVQEIETEKKEKEEKTVEKFDKIHSGISDLEALTSQLKSSFDDTSDDTQIQTQSQSVIPPQESKVAQDLKNMQSLVAAPIPAQVQVPQTTQVPVIAPTQAPVQALVAPVQAPVVVNAQIQPKPQVMAVKQAQVVQQPAQVAKVAPAPVTPKPTAPIVQPKASVVAQKSPVSVKSPMGSPTQPPIKPAKHAQVVKTKMVTPPNAKVSNQQQVLTKKMVNPSKVVAAKPATQSIAQKAKTDLKAKMHAVLAKSSAKQAKPAAGSPVVKKLNVIQKNAPKAQKPIKLAQVSSESDSDETLNLGAQEEQLSSLLETCHSVSAAFGFNKKKDNVPAKVESLAKNLGLQMDDQMKADTARKGSNKLIAETMAQRVLAQLNSGKKNEDVMKDLDKSKEALVLAQKAYFEKDPEAIEFLQLDSTINSSENEEIYLVSQDQNNQELSDEMQLQESESDQVGTSPSEIDDDVQALIDSQK